MANTWKKYGGMFKSDKYNSIGVGTMVADQVLIRQRVISSSQVEGSLIVGENVSVGMDLFVKNNTSISGELMVDNNSYFGNKLYFNNIKDTNENYIAYLYGNSKLGHLGIGTTAPKSFLDINVSNSITNSGLSNSTIGNTITEVLTVRNSNNKIRNIIAQNMHNSGIVVDTIGNIASIGFYNGNADISSATPPISIIADTTDGIFTIKSTDTKILSTDDIDISSTNITILSANDTAISSNNNISISANIDLSMNVSANTLITTGNNLNITTANISTINSIVSISKRGINDPMLNGTITIYDNSAEIFLADYYQQPTVKSGNAITIVSSDVSSNAFINIVTPNKNGLSIGGGAYPLDISRSMGTIGLTPTDASYLPAQVIVTNNRIDKHKISVGVNTYSPESTKYVMDINGPTRIGNGEMHIRKHTSFQQNTVHFSKQNDKFGVISGSPYYYADSVFNYDFYITYNGGVNWTQYSDICNNAITTGTYDILDVYSISQSEFFYIGTQQTGRLGHIKVDSTENKINTVYRGNNDNTQFRTIYAYIDTNSKYNILIGGKTTTTVPKDVIYYYKVESLDLINLTDTIDASCTDIKHCDGSENFAYFVGNGIEKFDFSAPIPTSVSYKASGLYNKVYVYDANYVVAVGDNLISYTHDGGENWIDVTTIIKSDTITINPYNASYPNFESGTSVNSFTINHIVLLDRTNGIATGSFNDGTNERPLIIRTMDGSVTWNRIDPKVFYSSGVGHYIEHTSLCCIVPSVKDSFVVVNNIINRVEETFIAGNSDIIYGYLPNIFNVYSNQVVDVNGGMNVDGKIWQF